jgi:hypothetical protein
MGVLRQRRLNRQLLRVALALSVGCLLAPAQARASCGDYVTVGSESSHPDAPKPTDPHSSQDSKRQQRPCHGPSCSGLPSPFPLASAPATPARDKEWAAAAFPTLVLEPGSLDALAEYSDRHAVRRGSSVFHPPRMSRAPFLP